MQRSQICEICGRLYDFLQKQEKCEENLRKHSAYIEGKLFLKVNQDKTQVAHISKVKYLGYSFYRYKGKCRLRVHPKSITKMRARLKELTARSNGWGNYFSLADMKGVLEIKDEWLRRRIRPVYWKQWKRVRTRFKMLERFGIEKDKAWEFANTRKGYWRTAKSPILQRSLDNKTIAI